MNLQAIWGLLKETVSEWSEDKASRLAAALSYYTIFSLAPLLVIVIAVAGLVFGEEAVQGRLVGQIEGLVGEQGASLIQTMIANASQSGSGLAALLGLGTLLFGAAGVFGQLQDALNTIWDVMPRPGRGIMGMVKDRLGAFAMVVGTGFLLLVSLVISAALTAAGQFAGEVLPLPEAVLQLINFAISFVVITLVFALIYKVIPDVEIAWSDVWIGAAITSLLFSIGKYLIGLYLGQSSASSVFGAAGSLVVVLLWIYYSSQILFFGAEFTQVYARRYGSGIKPSEEAIRLSETARAQQGIPRAGRGEAAGATVRGDGKGAPTVGQQSRVRGDVTAGFRPGDGEAPLPALVGHLNRQIRSLVQLEIALGRAEMTQNLSQLVKNVGMLAGGTAIVYLGLLALVATLIIVLAAILPWWISALVVGVLLAGVAFILVRTGLDNLKRQTPVPQQTVASLTEGLPLDGNGDAPAGRRPTRREGPERTRVEAVEPAGFAAYDDDFRRHYMMTFPESRRHYGQHLPAYHYGYILGTDPRYRGREWEEIEPEARRQWERQHPGTWEREKAAVRYAWERVGLGSVKEPVHPM